MKSFLKSLLAFFTIGGMFILGFWLGKEKEKAKIPEFQEESESTD